eukprot:3626298-Amphidinium_carterae.1
MLHKYLQWAGHLARAHGTYMHEVHFEADLYWWRQRQVLIQAGLTQLRHPGRFCPSLRWDSHVMQLWQATGFSAQTWHEAASDRIDWTQWALRQ